MSISRVAHEVEFGEVYMLINGQLCKRTGGTWSAPGQGQPLFRKKPAELQALTYLYKGLTTPPSLELICCHFVGVNIEHVESLVNFPEQLGKSILEIAMEKETSLDTKKSLVMLTLGSEAYREEFLAKLVLRKQSRFLHLHIDCISKVFNHLTVLDLSDCCVGDDNEILNQFIGKLDNLTDLGLANNNITDLGVQQLTAHARYWKTGPTKLRNLDLSGNAGITDKSVLYIRCFKNLELVALSGCSISTNGVHELSASCQLFLMKVPPATEYLLDKHATEGWVATQLMNWIHNYQVPTSNRTVNKLQTFYGNGLQRKLPKVLGTKMTEVGIGPTKQLVFERSDHRMKETANETLAPYTCPTNVQTPCDLFNASPCERNFTKVKSLASTSTSGKLTPTNDVKRERHVSKNVTMDSKLVHSAGKEKPTKRFHSLLDAMKSDNW